MSPKNGTIGTLEKALLILGCFSSHKLKLELKDIAKITKLNKSTILRMLSTMQSNDYIVKFPDGSYSVGSMLNILGVKYRELFDTSEFVEIAVKRIAERANESTAYYVIDGDNRICIYARNANRTIQHRFVVGNQIPLQNGGSASHVLQSDFDTKPSSKSSIKEENYSITIEERELDQASISVPVIGLDNSINGAIVVAGLKNRLTRDYLENVFFIIVEELSRVGLKRSSIKRVKQ